MSAKGIVFVIFGFYSIASLASGNACVDLLRHNSESAQAKFISDFNDRSSKPYRFKTDSDDKGRLGHQHAKRLLQGDIHPRILMKLGYRRVTDPQGGRLLVPPNSPLDIIVNYKKHLEENGVPQKKRFRLIALYVPKATIGDTRLAESDLLSVDLMADSIAWPDPNIYVPLSEHKTSQLPDNVFFKLLARGDFPFPSGNMIDHEMAHITEFLEDPEVVPAIRSYARKMAKPGALEKAKDNKLSVRANVVLEFFSIPDVKKSDDIQSIVKWIRGDQKLSPKELEARIEKKIESDPTFASAFAERSLRVNRRIGGGMRDGYGFEEKLMYQPVDYGTATLMAQIDPALKNVSETDVFVKTQPKTFIELSTLGLILGARDSFLGDLTAIRKLSSDWGKEYGFYGYGRHFTDELFPNRFTREEYEANINKGLAHKITQVVLGMEAAVDLQITGADFIRDSLQDHVNPHSKTARYLQAFLPETSFLRWAWEI